MSGAYDLVPPALSTPEMDELGRLRNRVLELWEESSNDAITFRIGLAYLRKFEPRLLWLGFSQSDDFAHARRYDRVLDYLHVADGFLEELWTTLQSLDAYRGRTTLIIWIAIIGPDTPVLGEVHDYASVSQSDIAATILQYLGLDYRDFNAKAGPPVPGSLRKSE
jgi:hypothetical protein